MSAKDEGYTPTMKEVREGYVYGAGPLPAYYAKDHPVALKVHGEQYDRAIAAHDRELREQIAQELREAGAEVVAAEMRRPRLSVTKMRSTQAAWFHAEQIARGKDA